MLRSEKQSKQRLKRGKKQVTFWALPIIGFPASMELMSWNDEILYKKRGKK